MCPARSRRHYRLPQKKTCLCRRSSSAVCRWSGAQAVSSPGEYSSSTASQQAVSPPRVSNNNLILKSLDLVTDALCRSSPRYTSAHSRSTSSMPHSKRPSYVCRRCDSGKRSSSSGVDRRHRGEGALRWPEDRDEAQQPAALHTPTLRPRG